MKEDRFLFHCFPSQFGAYSDFKFRADDQLMIKCGLDILTTTLMDGLLLTSETISIPRAQNSRAAADGRTHTKLPQTRASFTLASLDDLKRPIRSSRDNESHLDIFGRFSFGLDRSAARDLEILPVLYFYGAGAEDYVPATSSFLAALHEIRELISTIAMTEKQYSLGRGNITEEEEDYYSRFDSARIKLMYQDDSTKRQIMDSIRKMNFVECERLLGLFATDRRRFGFLVEAIDLLTGTIQNADSKSLSSELLYFDQREWRLIPVINDDLITYPLVKLTEEEDTRIQPLREQKQDAVLKIGRLLGQACDTHWMENFWVVLGSTKSGLAFRDYIEVILCPHGVGNQVKQILDRLSWKRHKPEVVEIENFQKQE